MSIRRSKDNFALRIEERFTLNPNSPEPLYHQMEQIILSRITTDGTIDKLLPSEAELGSIFGVSRVTVQKALENLTLKGYLERQRGRSTRITRPQFTEDLARLSSYSEEMQGNGLTIRTTLMGVSLHIPDQYTQGQLNTGPHEQTLCLCRLRGTSEVFPIVFFQTEIPARYQIDPADDFSGSLYKLLEEKYHLPIVNAQQTISSAVATTEQAEVLELKRGSSVLVIERQTYTHSGLPLEFSRGVYRPDRYKYSVRLKR
jgi:GntR family transcriptional regulator